MGQKPKKPLFLTSFWPITRPRGPNKAPKGVQSCSLTYSEHIAFLVAVFGPIFIFQIFFAKKNSTTSVGFGFGFWSVRWSGQWGEKLNFFSKTNSKDYHCLYVPSRILNIPYNSHNSPSSPFHDHFGKTFFFNFVDFWTLWGFLGSKSGFWGAWGVRIARFL